MYLNDNGRTTADTAAPQYCPAYFPKSEICNCYFL